MVPSERAINTESETGVKSNIPFCCGFSLGKTPVAKLVTAPTNIFMLTHPLWPVGSPYMTKQLVLDFSLLRSSQNTKR